jgi:hypothetical protein
MIPLWKGKNPIYFGVITIIPFYDLYRRAYFVMNTFLVPNIFQKKTKIFQKIIYRGHFLSILLTQM